MKSDTPWANEEYQLEQVREMITTSNYDGAWQLLQKVIGEHPESEKAFNPLGVLYEKREYLDAARRMYHVALALNPAYRPAQFNLRRLVQCFPDLTAFDLGFDYLQVQQPIKDIKQKKR